MLVGCVGLTPRTPLPQYLHADYHTLRAYMTLQGTVNQLCIEGSGELTLLTSLCWTGLDTGSQRASLRLLARLSNLSMYHHSNPRHNKANCLPHNYSLRSKPRRILRDPYSVIISI